MKLLATMACAMVLFGAASAVAAPMDDLTIKQSGRLCNATGQSGAAQIELVNANPSQAISATVSVDADVKSYPYDDAGGNPATFTYPFTRDVWVGAGGSAILGCASMRVGEGLANQTFAKVAATYQAAPAGAAEKPADFVGSFTQTRPARCVATNPGLFLMNRHPDRRIIAMVVMGGGAVGPVFIPPQGTSVWLGCQHDRPPGPIKIFQMEFIGGPEKGGASKSSAPAK